MTLHRQTLTGLTLAAAVLALGLTGCDRGSSMPMPQGVAAPAKTITLLLTGTTSGALEPCDCQGKPFGGLSRRQTVLNRVRAKVAPTVLLDAGNIIKPDAKADTYLLDGYRLLDYDAIAVGDQDLDRGVEWFMTNAGQRKLPLVATNVTTAEGEPIGVPYRRIERGGRSVLLLGVLGPGAMTLSKMDVKMQVEVTDPADAVNRVLVEQAKARQQAGRPTADLVVVVASLDTVEREEFVRRCHGVDVVVCSTTVDRLDEIHYVDESPYVYAPAGGRYVAEVAIEFPEAGRPRVASYRQIPVDQDLPKDSKLWEIYKAYDALYGEHEDEAKPAAGES